MRIATYNVNGITARLPRVLEWLEAVKPDVVCLQEIKIETDRFPRAAIEAAGYHALVHGQKGFHGVAILSREPAEERCRALPADAELDADDVQSRYIEAEVGGVIVGGLYLPNGNPQPGPKFDYKLRWMERLRTHARALLETERPVVLAGDYNVCPTDEDVFSMRRMADDALVQPESRRAFRALLADGWTDAIRARHPAGPVYTFWDYQAGAWQHDHGLRIDHLLLSPAAADRLIEAGVDRSVRGMEKASDHAPTWVKLQ
jgi:exodeoxyribonuclease-3